MRNLVETLDLLKWKAYYKAKEFFQNEEGDTNFISIAIILIIVLAVAILFITFKNQIVAKFNTMTDQFLDALGN